MKKISLLSALARVVPLWQAASLTLTSADIKPNST
jgi:hypothetical protein